MSEEEENTIPEQNDNKQEKAPFGGNKTFRRDAFL